MQTEHARSVAQHKKPKLGTMGIEEEEEMQAKDIENIFNKVIAENFPKVHCKVSIDGNATMTLTLVVPPVQLIDANKNV
jgi:thiamine phosphate synthase YjbQ (UPF0047 family)